MIVCARERSTLILGRFFSWTFCCPWEVHSWLFFCRQFYCRLVKECLLVRYCGIVLDQSARVYGVGSEQNIIRHATIKSIGKMGVAIFFKEILLLGLVSLVVSRMFNNHAFACFLVDFLVTTVVLIGFG